LPPAERWPSVFVTCGVLVVVTTVARLLIIPAPSGILQQVTVPSLLVGALLLVPALRELYLLERIRLRTPVEPDEVRQMASGESR